MSASLTQIYFVTALVATPLAAMATVFLFAPAELRDPVLRGYRATRRRDALAASALLRLSWPLIRLCTYYAQLIPAKKWKEDKAVQLRAAGEPAGLGPDEFLGLCIAAALGGAALAAAFAWLLELGWGLLIVGLFLGILLPPLWLAETAQTRLAAINRGLPQALDLIVLSMGAGLDFIGAVRHVVEKWSDKRDPLCEELSRFLHELGLGKTRKEALEDLALRAPTDMVRAFVTNAVQAEKRGTPLVEILRIQADVARTQRFQTAEKVAGRAGVVILMPLMFIFAATVLVMFGSLVVKGFRGSLFLMAAEAGKPFTLLVSLVGGRPVSYRFDQPRVLVGRGRDADLRIEHAGFGRSQFVIERGTGSLGEPRFRITPLQATNPTYVNDRPAVEGTLTAGDVVAVADVRVVLEQKLEKTAQTVRPRLSPLRAVLLTAVVGMALVVGWLVFASGDDDNASAGALATAQATHLFGELPEVRCANPIECDTRAHDAYGRGKKLLAQAAADPGNYYRATLELERAGRFREQSGRPLPDMADVGALAASARSRAEAEFADAKFRLQRAMAAGDYKRCAVEAALLAQLVPDESHPYRVKLDAYRRTLPRTRPAGSAQ